MTIFGAYDVRGVYPKDINPHLAEKIGLTFPDVVSTKKILVGYDARKTSPKLFNALVSGLKKRGMQIFTIGLCSKPQFFFSAFFYEFDAGIYITASHNPSQYNGFKFVGKNGIQMGYDQGLEKLEQLINRGNWHESLHEGLVVKFDTGIDYDMFLEKYIIPNKELKIVIDSLNGTGSRAAKLLANYTNATLLNNTPNGNFPKKNPNPTVAEVRKPLEQKVKQTKAAIGIAFDGDADRVVFVNEKGKVVPPDFILALLIDHLGEKGDRVVVDALLSKVVDEECKKNKIKVYRSKVGTSYIIQNMKRKRARFGAEWSGHFYFEDLNHSDSGVLCAIHVLNIMKVTQQKLSDLIKPYERYIISEMRNFEVDDKQAVIDMVNEDFKGKKDRLDGLSVETDTYKFNIRPSNTEPLLRCRIEGKKQDEMNRVLREIDIIVANVNKGVKKNNGKKKK